MRKRPLFCKMLIDTRAVDAMAASNDEVDGEAATTAASNVSRNVTQTQQSDEQPDPRMEARRRELADLLNGLPTAKRDMLRAYFAVTQPSSPDTAAAANRGGPTTPNAIPIAGVTEAPVISTGGTTTPHQ